MMTFMDSVEADWWHFTLSVAVAVVDENGHELLMMLELECVIPRWLTLTLTPSKY